MSGGETPQQASGPQRALPSWLHPWLGRAFAAIWTALLVAAGAALAFGIVVTWQERHETGALRSGLGLHKGLRNAVYVQPFSDEARKTGIRANDMLLAVDGRPIVGSQLVVNRNLDGPSGSKVTITTRARNGAIQTHVLTRRSANLEAFKQQTGITAADNVLIQLLASIVVLPLFVAAGILLFRQRKRQWIAGLLSLTFLLLANGEGSSGLAYSAIGAGAIAGTMTASGITLLVIVLLLLPDGRFASRWGRWAAILALISGVASQLGLYNGIAAYWFGLAIILSLFGLAVASFISRYRQLPAGAERQQLRWAMLGFALGFALLIPSTVIGNAVANADVTPAIWVWTDILTGLFNAAGFALIPAGLLISLLKYRLYDADAAISRSVSIGALTITLLAVFAGSEKIIELWGEEYFGHSIGVLAGGIGAALAAVLLVPLHHRLSHWAEHRFQKDLIRLKHGLPLLVGDMRETAPVHRIAAATLDSVVRGVRASRAALVLDGELLDARGIEPDEFVGWRRGWHPAAGDGLDAAREDPLFPLRVPLEADGHGRIGWLLLGPRPDGSFYGKDERETLAAIADPVARTLEIAAAREKREAEEAQRWRAQESLNAEIRSVNGELVRILGSLDDKLDRLFPPPAAAAE